MSPAMFWVLVDVLMIVTAMAPEDAPPLDTACLARIWPTPTPIFTPSRIALSVTTLA